MNNKDINCIVEQFYLAIRLKLITLVLCAGSYGPAFAANIVSVQKVDVVGAHGMAVDSENRIILADTFKSQDANASRLFQIQSDKILKLPFQGLGISGITAISTGFLICDLQASVVYKTNKAFEIENSWSVENPWTAKIDSEGNIFILTHAGRFVVIDSAGKQKILISNLDAPFDFTFIKDFSGIWISEQGEKEGRVSLWKFDKSNKIKRALTSKYNWQNPEGLLFHNGILWVVDTELGELIQIDEKGSAKLAVKELGIPILIQKLGGQMLVYSNNFKGGPALVQIGY